MLLILCLIHIVLTIALLALNLYQYICLSDLESDYLNPYESSTRINGVVVPEFVTHGALCVLCLLTGSWFMFLITLPIAWLNMMLFFKQRHLIDVTEVFRSLSSEKRFRIIKLGFYAGLICLVLIRLIFIGFNSLSEDDLWEI